jgi:hypothetical protein
VKRTFFPRDSALLIDSTLSDGCAMKKSSIGIERPGVWPVAHVVPEPLNCASGT